MPRGRRYHYVYMSKHDVVILRRHLPAKAGRASVRMLVAFAIVLFIAPATSGTLQHPPSFRYRVVVFSIAIRPAA